MREKVKMSNYGDVHFWISEDWDDTKKTIFFLHGLTANHTMFDDQVEYFKKDFNVITWDAPMHGASKPFEGFSMEVAVEIILSFMDAIGVDKFIAVGQSFGGYFVQSIMLRAMERVELFIGIGTTPYGSEYYSISDYFWLKQIPQMSKYSPFGTLKKIVAKLCTFTAKGYNNMCEMLKDHNKEEYLALTTAYYKAAAKDNRPFKIECPVLIIAGRFDEVGKVKHYCKLWHQKTGYPYEIIPNAGHNCNVDNPDATNRVIETFIRSKLNI